MSLNESEPVLYHQSARSQFLMVMALLFMSACMVTGFWVIARLAWQLWKGLCI